MKLSLVTESSMNMSYCIVSNAVLSKMHIYGYESEESRDYFLIGEDKEVSGLFGSESVGNSVV